MPRCSLTCCQLPRSEETRLRSHSHASRCWLSQASTNSSSVDSLNNFERHGWRQRHAEGDRGLAHTRSLDLRAGRIVRGIFGLVFEGLLDHRGAPGLGSSKKSSRRYAHSAYATCRRSPDLADCELGSDGLIGPPPAEMSTARALGAIAWVFPVSAPGVRGSCGPRGPASAEARVIHALPCAPPSLCGRTLPCLGTGPAPPGCKVHTESRLSDRTSVSSRRA